MKLTLRELRSASVLGPLADLSHTATTLAELIHSNTKAYAGKSCDVTFKALNKSGGVWHLTYHVFGKQDYSDPRGHLVRIRFFPEAHVEDPLDLDVDVSCDCEAFLYYGAQYNVHSKDALERQQQGSPLIPANLAEYPEHDWVVCKHIYAVSERVGERLEKHMKKHTEDSDWSEKVYQQSLKKVQEKQTPPTSIPPQAPVPVETPQDTEEEV